MTGFFWLAVKTAPQTSGYAWRGGQRLHSRLRGFRQEPCVGRLRRALATLAGVGLNPVRAGGLAGPQALRRGFHRRPLGRHVLTKKEKNNNCRPLAGVLLSLLVLLVLAGLSGCTIFSVQAECQNFTVPNAAMEPTLQDGQLVVLDTLSYSSAKPARGNLVVLKDPANTSQQEVLRVIGLPGETVRLTETQTFISGKLLEEPFVLNRGIQQPLARTLGPDDYFVMGDNRPASIDSRSWGPLPLADIVGQINTQYCPND